jgi:uncharacterized protein YjbJ (UPF0337 family)
MNRHQVKGVTNQVTGEIKQQVGKLSGDRSTVARGQASEVKGKLQKGMGDAKEAVRRTEREQDAREIERQSLARRRTDR